METRWKAAPPPSPPASTRSPVIIRIAVCGRAIGERPRGHTLDINLYALLDILTTVSRRYLGEAAERGNSIFPPRGREGGWNFQNSPLFYFCTGETLASVEENFGKLPGWEGAVDSSIVTLQLPRREIFFFLVFEKKSQIIVIL